jgi:MOSC domain-containing protein YiiM/catechol 2,3-dioxygenase-like lactoylglutathione lyase family enzyme
VNRGTIHQIGISKGGVPKLPVPEAEVARSGIVGDGHRLPNIHGGPYRALCLFALEIIERLRAEGHPIVPGGAGENVTTSGLDWTQMAPGLRLRLGSEVLIELTAFAGPCQTIAGNFADRNFNLINHGVDPASSRVYAKVLETGAIRVNDEIVVDAVAESLLGPAELRIAGVGQVAVRVRDLDRSIGYYRDTLGLQLDESAPPPGLAVFVLGNVELVLQGPGYDGLGPMPVGTLYLGVGDIHAGAADLTERGVAFEAGPLVESRVNASEVWVAFFRDPDGNRIALVEERRVH